MKNEMQPLERIRSWFGRFLKHIQPVKSTVKPMPHVWPARFVGRVGSGLDDVVQASGGQCVCQCSNQKACADAAGVKQVERVVGSAEDGMELAVKEAAQLILKTMTAKGFMNGAQLSATASDDETVNGTGFIADGKAVLCKPFNLLNPMVGVCREKGEYVLVVGSWMVPFEQLRVHGFLSEDELQRLKESVKKVARDLFKQQRRFAQLVERKSNALPTGLSESDDALLGYIVKYLHKSACKV